MVGDVNVPSEMAAAGLRYMQPPPFAGEIMCAMSMFSIAFDMQVMVPEAGMPLKHAMHKSIMKLPGSTSMQSGPGLKEN